MKKIFKFIIVSLFLANAFTLSVNAVDCTPSWNGDWNTTEDCTFPNGYKVYGNINVGAHTITLGPNTDLGIDLSINKITFIDDIASKIISDATSKIANHVVTRFYKLITFTSGAGTTALVTSCPTGLHAFYHQVIPTDPAVHYFIPDGTKVYVGTSGNMYCGKK